jgi:hypothetical protein
MNSVAAKEFLIARVVQEAEFEKASLSEVERKMLYFTEVHPSLPDVYEVNAEFERNYDADDYESKIASLLRNARNRDRNESAAKEQEWEDALDALKKEDHYLLVMVHQAFSGASATAGNRLRDFAIYSAVGIGLVVILYLASMWTSGR